MGSNKPKIDWEDSDDDFSEEFSEPKIKEIISEDENEFSDLLDEVKADISEIPLRVGQKIDCELILASPDKDDALCEIDGKRSAVIARHELLDQEGELGQKMPPWDLIQESTPTVLYYFCVGALSTLRALARQHRGWNRTGTF